MAIHKFKNPRVNNQYRKPACHTDYCFERMACCNNYRCCVCHCCLPEYAVYDKVKNTCTSNSSSSELLRKSTKKPSVTKASTISTTVSTTTRKPTRKEVPTLRRTTTKGDKNKKDNPNSLFKFMTTTGKYQNTATKPTTTIGNSTSTFSQTVGAERNIGRRQTRDEKTSTIAGVVVALALVAVVAIIVLIVVCSKRRKKRKQDGSTKTREQRENNDGGVVTIPLTMENVEGSIRDNEEATTSDTTIDSPINPINHAGNTSDCNGTVANQLTPNYAAKSSKNGYRKHRKARDWKTGRRFEETPLYVDTSFNCNGSVRSDATYSSSDSGGSRNSKKRGSDIGNQSQRSLAFNHQSHRSLASNHVHQAGDISIDGENRYEGMSNDGKNGQMFDHCMNVMTHGNHVTNHQIGVSG